MDRQEYILAARAYIRDHGWNDVGMTDDQVEKAMTEATKKYADACVNAWKGISKAFAEVIGIARALKSYNYGPHTNNWRKMHGLPMRRKPGKIKHIRPLIKKGRKASFVVIDELHEYRR